jgi:hypothetical protein
VGPGASLDRYVKSCLTGILSPDFPARSESLYRLRYTGSLLEYTDIFYTVLFNEFVQILE